jgi:O-antigen/teichoic acid export membrane protein
VLSGLLINVYLAIVARSLPAAEYAYFGAFWSLALVAGYGVFLPIEQETARLLQTPGRPGRVLRASLTTAAVMAVVLLVVVAVASPLLVHSFGGHATTVVALGVLCLISAGQFVVRGALIGLDRMGWHALLMLWDTVLRVAFAVAVASLVAEPSSSEFAWTLVAAIVIAHVPMLYLLMNRRIRPGRVPPLGPQIIGERTVAVAVAPLLLGSLCAQLLLNGPPVLVPALAVTEADATRAGQFLAAFTLTRIPLFLVVPLQTALLPMLTNLLHTRDRATLRRAAKWLCAGLLALGVVAVILGYTIGPALVSLIFGPRYALPGADLALLALGVTTYMGLVIITQALVASARHRQVAWSWLSGVAIAALVFALVPDLLLRAELAFLIGSTVGWIVGSTLLLARRRDRELQNVQ